ncbi:MAG: hypothetical protein V3V62_01090 [bacterium]
MKNFGKYFWLGVLWVFLVPGCTSLNYLYPKADWNTIYGVKNAKGEPPTDEGKKVAAMTYIRALREVYKNRERANRFAIYGAGVTGLGTIGAITIIKGSKEDQGGNDSILILGAVGTFLTGALALFQSECKAKAYKTGIQKLLAIDISIINTGILLMKAANDADKDVEAAKAACE